MTHGKLRLIGLMLLACALLSVGAFAKSDGSFVYQAVPETSGERLPYDSGTLFEGYADRAFGQVYRAPSQVNRANLTELEQRVYDALLSAVKDIADGKRSNTLVTIPYSSVGLKTTWTPSTLGVAFLKNGEPNWNGIQEALEAYYADKYDARRLIRAVMRDNPYDFYWLSNRYDIEFTTPSANHFQMTSDGKKLMIDELTFYFIPDELYAGSRDYQVDTNKTGAVRTAVAAADAIVAAAADMSDIGRMTYFMQRIRALSDYDVPAATGYAENSAPWQLVYVFDGDPDTKVVCEGYSKAFQYLCDRTDFTDEKIKVYTVSGWMYDISGYGAHMWNVVHTRSGNYMVDVTNCLTSGSREDSLFFSAPIDGDPEGGYYFYLDEYPQYSWISPEVFLYVYDEPYFGYGELALSFDAFEPAVLIDAALTLHTGDRVKLWDETFGFVPCLPLEDTDYSLVQGDTAICLWHDDSSLEALAEGVTTVRLVSEAAVIQLELTVEGFDDTIVLPAGLTSLGSQALAGSSAARVVLPATLEELASDAFDGMSGLSEIVVPTGLSESVLAAIPTGEGIRRLCGDAAAVQAAKDGGCDYLFLAD